MFVLKRGGEGCEIFTRDSAPSHVPPFRIEVLNVLGAGDAFASGFIYGYLQGWSPEQAGRFGNAVGAIVVTRHGCANFMPSLAEVRDFIPSIANPWPPTSGEHAHSCRQCPLLVGGPRVRRPRTRAGLLPGARPARFNRICGHRARRLGLHAHRADRAQLGDRSPWFTLVGAFVPVNLRDPSAHPEGIDARREPHIFSATPVIPRPSSSWPT